VSAASVSSDASALTGADEASAPAARASKPPKRRHPPSMVQRLVVLHGC